MSIVTVTYPNTKGSRFDAAYYVDKHVGLIRGLWKDQLTSIELLRGVAGLRGGPAAFHYIAILKFHSDEAMKAAFGNPGAAGMGADIANFTDVVPAMQINEPG